jgi:hypothetical protein
MRILVLAIEAAAALSSTHMAQLNGNRITANFDVDKQSTCCKMTMLQPWYPKTSYTHPIQG